MPFSEVMGYIMPPSFFVVLAIASRKRIAFATMKWLGGRLLYSAAQLWGMSLNGSEVGRQLLVRVCLTTLIKPQGHAGRVLIPAGADVDVSIWVGT
ncbi:hypothetical protein GHK03_22240 [Sinorhizobium medicae]|uniref:hypothetical protein n=1 Tax=Sinorhizobium medicae TaxID=110321 RepID=UPI001297C9EA|nr:hypothetical protein [Sinorhizobium medicae]MQX98754.1 hypothetical protein [Sinorhizobium medicae]